MQQLNGKGRVELHALPIDPHTTITIYNIYGWTNANYSSEAQQRTSGMLEAILQDMDLQPPGPMYIMGDLNGDPPPLFPHFMLPSHSNS